MNREISFRALGADGVMHYNIIPNGRTYMVLSKVTRSDTGEYELFDAQALMQYTGRRDEKGSRIFEGDIIRGFTMYSGSGNRGKYVPETAAVRWDDQKASWSVFPMFFEWRIEESKLEVIGNIYEHPHLLEPTQ